MCNFVRNRKFVAIEINVFVIWSRSGIRKKLFRDPIAYNMKSSVGGSGLFGPDPTSGKKPDPTSGHKNPPN
jgi:hypothetical protein